MCIQTLRWWLEAGGDWVRVRGGQRDNSKNNRLVQNGWILQEEREFTPKVRSCQDYSIKSNSFLFYSDVLCFFPERERVWLNKLFLWKPEKKWTPLLEKQNRFWYFSAWSLCFLSTVWCSKIGSLTSPDACKSGAHGRSRVDKKFRAILRGGRGGRPSLCMCFKGYCSPLTSLVELLNLLPGALRAFRTPTPLSEPDPLGSRRTADERSFPSIPSLPWSAKEKLISVVWGRCYAQFTLAKVVLFRGLFSPFQAGQFLNLFDMCERHLRTFCLASRHDWTIWFLRVSSAFRLQLGTLDTAARPIDSTDHIREAARWPLFVWQFVLVTPLQHLFVSSSIEAGCCWEKGTVLEAGKRGSSSIYKLEATRRILLL